MSEPVAQKVSRSSVSMALLFSLIIPVTVLIWWAGLIIYTITDGDTTNIDLHIGYDGLDWKMTKEHQEKK